MPGQLARSPGLDPSEFARVVEGVQQGRYHLLLGAGASFGVSNPAGPLPMADDLEHRLLEELATPPSVSVGLARAYEAVIAEHGLDFAVSVLRRLYADCESASWHGRLAELPWEAIWSFNIDDVVEVAYSRNTTRAQQAVVVVPSDPVLPYGGETDQVPVVHLHGYVGRVDERSDPALVFGRAEYLSALHGASQWSWHTRFRGDYPMKPFIMMGARLRDELDLLEVVQQGNFAARFGRPSLVVLPEIDEFTRSEYTRWGLIPVEMSAEDFLVYLADAVSTGAPAPGAYMTRYLDRTLAPLAVLPDEVVSSGHDFYGGHAPYWEDVVDGLDAEPSWVTHLADEIGDPSVAPARQILYVLHGPPFSGKSTGLLRVARALQLRGWEPTHLVGHERINPPEVLRYFAERPNALLLVDGLASDIGDLVSLLAQAVAADTPLLVVGAERDVHLGHLRRATPPKLVAGLNTTVFVQPTAGLWSGIVDKRHDHARLGILEGLPRLQQELHFVTHGRDLYSSLASLEDASGFINRGVEEYSKLPGDLRGALTAIALIARYGLPAPIAVVSEVAEMRSADLVTACDSDGSLSDLVELDRRDSGVVRLRHGYLGDLICSRQCDGMREVSLGEVSQRICLGLADRVSLASIRRKTLEYRIVRELMDLESVKEATRTTDVDDWYAVLEPVYSWTARYWEQRALGLVTALDRASSYARRALAQHRDPFTLNTLGTILMRRAVADDVTDPTVVLRYWSEADVALRDSRDMADGEFEHPFMTFFTYSHRLLERRLPGEVSDRIELAYREWIIEVKATGHYATSHVRSSADAFPPAWRE